MPAHAFFPRVSHYLRYARVAQAVFTLYIKYSAGHSWIGAVVIQLATFAAVQPDLDAGLCVNLVEIAWERLIDMLAHTIRNITTETLSIKLITKATIYT